MPLGCGAAMAGAAALVAFYDPAAPGTHFPGCIFHTTTGLWCPGCGLTRGFHQLLTGHPMAALGENVFVPVVLVAVVASWYGWLRESWGRPAHPWHARSLRWLHRSMQTVMPAALVVYGVLRNIPAAPFRSLAP
jgi:Protein of unknown function (DUF2752)